jgi:hypothetical protein
MELNLIRKPVFLKRRVEYVVGVDLGQSTDPTAICVAEWQRGVTDAGSDYERHLGMTSKLQTPDEQVWVRHLERLPLGLSYPAVVQRVADILARPPLCGDADHRGAELIIDETGVGRAVGDIFVDAGLKPKRVTITGGNDPTVGHGSDRFHVPKTVLISNVDAMLHTGALRFAAALTEAEAMRDELQDFRRKLSEAGRATYAARTGRHDDLVLAVAIAAWWIARPAPPQAVFGTYGRTGFKQQSNFERMI